MADTKQFDYLLALCLIFAFLDVYGIGANDVANSFGNISPLPLPKLWQAVCPAIIAEFLMALLLGARVTRTIKNGIVGSSYLG